MANKENKGAYLPLFALLGLVLISAGTKAANKLVMPAAGKITSKFGKRKNPITGKDELHGGIDIDMPVNTPIKSPLDGRVSKIYTTDRGGLQVIIKHNNGLTTGYAHLSKVVVKVGDEVDKGEMFALSGNTGEVTAPHLHFTIKDKKGKAVNPSDYFR